MFHQCCHHCHQNHQYNCDLPGLLLKETSFRMVTLNLVMWQIYVIKTIIIDQYCEQAHWTPGSVTGALEASALQLILEKLLLQLREDMPGGNHWHCHENNWRCYFSKETMVTLECVVLRWSGPHQQLDPAIVDKISNLNLHFDFRFRVTVRFKSHISKFADLCTSIACWRRRRT